MLLTIYDYVICDYESICLCMSVRVMVNCYMMMMMMVMVRPPLAKSARYLYAPRQSQAYELLTKLVAARYLAIISRR